MVIYLSVSFQIDRRAERKRSAKSTAGNNGILQVPETHTAAKVELPFTEDGATRKGRS